MAISIEKTFLRHLQVAAPDKCWEWQGPKANGGYGDCICGSADMGNLQRERAHRVSFRLFRGPIPDDLLVCHKCDNPLCINPKHLFLGTCKENGEDAAAKGRCPRGQKHHAHKLTENEVRLIRKLHMQGWSYSQIKEQVPVNVQAIAKICRRERWKHIV